MIIKEDQRKRAKAIATKLTRPILYSFLLLLSFTLGSLFASSPNSCFHPVITKAPPIPYLADTPNRLDQFRVTTRCADRPVDPDQVRQTLLDRLFDATSPYDGFPPPHALGVLRHKRIKGWGSQGAVFENLLRRVRPRTVVELGTFLGASAIHMANLTRRLGLRTQILCVDDFRGWPGFRDKFKDIPMVNGDVLLYHQFLQNVIAENFTDVILPVPFSTGAALEKLCEYGIFGDLIEIDAGHDFNSAWSDINRAFRILSPGGVLFGHDYFTAADNRGVRRAVNMFASLHGFKIQTDGQHWVIYPFDHL